MRNDYFTPTELESVIGISYNTIMKRINTPGYFKGIRPGAVKRYIIIHKADFFAWYFDAYNAGKIPQLFPCSQPDHRAIVQAHKEYSAWKMVNNEKLRREYLANKRPAYRRKDCYGL